MTMNALAAVRIIDSALDHAQLKFEEDECDGNTTVLNELRRVVAVQPTVTPDGHVVTPEGFLLAYMQLVTAWSGLLESMDEPEFSSRSNHLRFFCSGTSTAVTVLCT